MRDDYMTLLADAGTFFLLRMIQTCGTANWVRRGAQGLHRSI